MRRLLDFLYQFRLLIVFVVLQLLNISLIFQQKAFHRSKVLRSTNEVTGVMYNWRTSLFDYFSLKGQNEKLNEENARLRSLIRSNYFELYSSSEETFDTLLSRQFIFRPAKVVNNSFTLRDNQLTLDKGLIHGINAGMGVINSQGVVGVIKDCSRHYSTVVPLLHSRFSTSGRIGQSEYFGRVFWNGLDYRKAILEDVPAQSGLKLDDVIYSTSHSGIFPPDVPIGTVSKIIEGNDLFMSAEINLSVDFSRLSYVEVIANELIVEKDSIESIDPIE